MLILASASPRRRQLLAQAGYVFEVQAPSTPEEQRPGEDGIRLATRLAREKAEAVLAVRLAAGLVENRPPSLPETTIVLGADTVVISGGEILGKPANAEDAARMLRNLSGKTHQVVTGVAALARRGPDTALEVAAELTHVTVSTLSESEIAAYLARREYEDKAGAYAIQGFAARWIPRIQGCYFNVVGLPLALVSNLLEEVPGRLGRSSLV